MRIVYILLGGFFILTGIIGLFIPIFPTVPFLFVGFILLMKASERFKRWVRSRRFYKKHFLKYEVDGKIPLKIKIYTGILTALFIIALIAAVSVLLYLLKTDSRIFADILDLIKDKLPF